jgi:hypothetical protein
VIRRAALLGAIAAAIAASGCGGDESGNESPSVSIPDVTAPTASTPTFPQTTTSQGITGTNGKTFNPNAPDSETNDVPPPPGSPQEAFEKQCQQNPQACG